jgi:hypothetical protein
MLRAICNTADLLVLYDTHAWSYVVASVTVYGPTPATTHLVRDGATHRGDQDDAPSIPEADHLPPCSLRSEQHSVRVDFHHLTE